MAGIEPNFPDCALPQKTGICVAAWEPNVLRLRSRGCDPPGAAVLNVCLAVTV